MAKARPWYKRNGGAFIMGTMGMDLETRGAYSIIIDLLNDHDRPIPDDPQFMAGLLKISVRRWSQIRATLLAYVDENGKPTKLYVNGQGYLTNPRFEEERAERRGEHERSVVTGREGGKKAAAMKAAAQGDLGLSSEKEPEESRESTLEKSAKVEKPSEINLQDPQFSAGSGQGPPIASRAGATARQRLEVREEEESSPPTTDSLPTREADFSEVERLAARAGAAAGIDVGSHRTNWGDQLDAVRAWMATGLDPDTEIIPHIEQDAVDHDKPRWSLAYFTPAFARIAAQKKARTNGKRPAASKRNRADDDWSDPLLRSYDPRVGHPGGA